MLSILIPTYNFDCLLLIRALHDQCEKLRAEDLAFDYEIIVADDCSPMREVVSWLDAGIRQLGERVRLLSLNDNVGRAEVRNVMLCEARGVWMMMIDSDAQVVREDFVKRYWEVRDDADVTIGGILHPSVAERGHELRIAYERSFEKQRWLSWRQRHPYANFSVFNLMARRDVLTRFCFDTRCAEYGYEDFFLGVALATAGVRVSHIDNPLLHTGIDTSYDFLRKTETAVRTLSRLPMSLRRMTGLEIHASRFRNLHLDGVFVWVFTCFRTAVRRQLLSRYPSVVLLQLYKLACYLQCCKACV